MKPRFEAVPWRKSACICGEKPRRSD